MINQFKLFWNVLDGNQDDTFEVDAWCCNIQSSRCEGPVEPELALDHAASKSGGNHIHGLGTLGDNGVIGESHGGGIVGLDERPPLGPFHFDEILV